MAQKWTHVSTVVTGGLLAKDNLTVAQCLESLQSAVKQYNSTANELTAKGALRAVHDACFSGHSEIARTTGGLHILVDAVQKFGERSVELTRLFHVVLHELVNSERVDVETQQLMGLQPMCSDLIRASVKIAKKHHTLFDIQMETFRVFRALLNCQPCKAQFCNSMLDTGVYELLARHLQGNRLAAAQSGSLVLALCSSATNRTRLLDSGMLKQLLATFRHHSSEGEVCEIVCRVMRAVDRDARVRQELISGGTIELLVTALSTHASNAPMLLTACDVLASLCLDDKASARAVAKGAVETVVVFILKTHRDDPQLQQVGCSLLVRLFKTGGHDALTRVGTVDVIDILAETTSRFKDMPLVVETAGEVIARLMHDEASIEAIATSHCGILKILMNTCALNSRNVGVHRVTCLVLDRMAAGSSAAVASNLAAAKHFPFETIDKFLGEPRVLSVAIRCFRALLTHKLKDVRMVASSALDANIMETLSRTVAQWIQDARTDPYSSATVAEGMQTLLTLMTHSDLHDFVKRHIATCGLPALNMRVFEAFEGLPGPVLGERDPSIAHALAAARELAPLLSGASAGSSSPYGGAGGGGVQQLQADRGLHSRQAPDGGARARAPQRAPSHLLALNGPPEGLKTAMHATQSLKNMVKSSLLVRRADSRMLTTITPELDDDLGGVSSVPNPPSRGDSLATILMSNIASGIPRPQSSTAFGASSTAGIATPPDELEAASGDTPGEGGNSPQRSSSRLTGRPRGKSYNGSSIRDARSLEALVEVSEPVPPAPLTPGPGGASVRSRSHSPRPELGPGVSWFTPSDDNAAMTVPAPPPKASPSFVKKFLTAPGLAAVDGELRSESPSRVRGATPQGGIGISRSGPRLAPLPPRSTPSPTEGLPPRPPSVSPPRQTSLPGSGGPSSRQGPRPLPALFMRPRLASDSGAGLPALDKPAAGTSLRSSGSFRFRPAPLDTGPQLDTSPQNEPELSPPADDGGRIKLQKRADSSPVPWLAEKRSAEKLMPRLFQTDGRRQWESDTGGGSDLAYHPLFGEASPTGAGQAGPSASSTAAVAANATSRLVSGALASGFRDGALRGNIGKGGPALFKEDGADFLMAMQNSTTEMTLIVDVLQRVSPAQQPQASPGGSRRGGALTPQPPQFDRERDRDASPSRGPSLRGGRALSDPALDSGGFAATQGSAPMFSLAQMLGGQAHSLPSGSTPRPPPTRQPSAGRANLAAALTARRERLAHNPPQAEHGRQAITPAPPKPPRNFLPSLRSTMPRDFRMGEPT